jgi:tripartite-type tricarboxylate transporter receptor subunit TctC
MNMLHNFRVASCVAAATAIVSAPALADPIADFYKGKTMKVIVGSAPGGGYDTYARTTARHLRRFIPGEPNLIVQNRPGAASINAANFVYTVAPQDGSVIAAIQRGAPILQIMGEKGPKFEATKFQWLGSLNSDAGALYVWHTAKVQSFKDAFKNPVFFGSSGPNDTEFYPALANNLLGAKFALIKGYKSAPMIRIAMERGEVEGISQTWASVKAGHPTWVPEGKIKPLVQVTLKPVKDLTKMGVPMMMDFVTREHVLPEYSVEDARAVFKLMLTGKTLSRPYAYGPKVPKERVIFMRAAFMKMANDPKFVADAKKEHRDVDPISGEEMQKVMEELSKTPKQVLANAKELIKFKGITKQAKIHLVKVTTKVTKLERKGRTMFFMHDGKEIKTKISGSRTKITIGGKKAKRSKVEVGMTCTFSMPKMGAESTNVDCK